MSIFKHTFITLFTTAQRFKFSLTLQLPLMVNFSHKEGLLNQATSIAAKRISAPFEGKNVRERADLSPKAAGSSPQVPA